VLELALQLSQLINTFNPGERAVAIEKDETLG